MKCKPLGDNLSTARRDPAELALTTYGCFGEMLEIIAKQGDVIGFDLVEVSPPYDPTSVTSLTVARLIMDFIGFILKEREMKAN